MSSAACSLFPCSTSRAFNLCLPSSSVLTLYNTWLVMTFGESRSAKVAYVPDSTASDQLSSSSSSALSRNQGGKNNKCERVTVSRPITSSACSHSACVSTSGCVSLCAGSRTSTPPMSACPSPMSSALRGREALSRDDEPRATAPSRAPSASSTAPSCAPSAFRPRRPVRRPRL
jgi:hypothetical protein